MSILTAPLPYRQTVEATGGTIEFRSNQPVTAATYVLTRDNVQVGAGTGSVTAVTGGAQVTCTIPALAIDDGYECRLTLTGGDHSSGKLIFDVVRDDLGPLVTLDEILAERGSENIYIEQRAAVLGVTSDQFVERIAGRARAAIDLMVKDRIQRLYDEVGNVDAEFPGRDAYTSVFTMRTRAILDTDLLRMVELNLAVAELYKGKMSTTSADDDSDAMLYNLYVTEAKTIFESMGNIRIDVDDDGAEDFRADMDMSVTYVRVQG